MESENRNLETKEDIIKDSLEIIKGFIPTIIEKAEESKLNIIESNARTLLKYADKIGENYEKSKNYLDDMNECCNNMFNFMRENKLEKELKSIIIQTILSTYKINEVYGYYAIYIKQFENGKYEGQMKDGKMDGEVFYLRGVHNSYLILATTSPNLA